MNQSFDYSTSETRVSCTINFDTKPRTYSNYSATIRRRIGRSARASQRQSRYSRSSPYNRITFEKAADVPSRSRRMAQQSTQMSGAARSIGGATQIVPLPALINQGWPDTLPPRRHSSDSDRHVCLVAVATLLRIKGRPKQLGFDFAAPEAQRV